MLPESLENQTNGMEQQKKWNISFLELTWWPLSECVDLRPSTMWTEGEFRIFVDTKWYVGASWGLQDLHQDSVSPACQTSFSPSAFDQQSGQNFCNSLFTRCQCSREPSDMSTLIPTYSLSHPYLICSCNDTSSDDTKHQLSAMTLLLVLNSQQWGWQCFWKITANVYHNLDTVCTHFPCLSSNISESLVLFKYHFYKCTSPPALWFLR